MELRTISHHLLSQEHLLHTQVDLAPVVVQQVAAMEIPMSQDRRSPIWPCTSLMMMSLPMTHTKLYPLRMPLLFPTFQVRILKGSTSVTFYQQRSLGFEEPIIISYVRPGYTGAFLWDYPLDHQRHVALKFHSGVAAYSSYIGLVSTRIVYPQQEDPDIKID